MSVRKGGDRERQKLMCGNLCITRLLLLALYQRGLSCALEFHLFSYLLLVQATTTPFYFYFIVYYVISLLLLPFEPCLACSVIFRLFPGTDLHGTRHQNPSTICNI